MTPQPRAAAAAVIGAFQTAKVP